MMKRKHRKLALMTALAGMLLTNSAVLAAPAEGTSEFELDTVVVTATKTEKSIKDVPASVSVITADDLAKANFKTLDQALHYVPGMYIKESQGMMGTKISLRGMTQSQVLVLMDGIPLNNGYSGGTNWGNIPIALIDRVEVIKGSFSSLYGTNAMGGVINIITKKDVKTQTIIKGGFGGNGTTTSSFFTSGQAENKKFQYVLSYDYRDVDGHANQPEQLPGGVRYGKFATKNENSGIKLMYDFSEGERLSLLRTESNYTYGYYEGGKDKGQRKLELTGITYEKKLDDTKELKIHLGEQNYKNYWQIANGNGPNPNPVKTKEADISLNWAINTKNLLTFGVATKEDKGSQYNKTGQLTATATTKTNAVYLQDEITMNPKSTLYLGARYDEWKTSNTVKNGQAIADRSISNVSPKASFHYKADDKVTLYASAGKAFNSPTIMNVAFDYKDLQANSDLQPEEMTSYEIGAYLSTGPKTTTKLALFKNNVNLIYQGANRWQQGDAEIRGFEVEVNQKFSPELTGFINYTYNDAKFTNNPNGYTGNRVPTVPMDTLTFGCTYAKDKWTTNLLGRYIGTAYENEKNTYGFMSHFVADVKLNYAMSKNTSLALAVDNVFDRKYYQRVDTFNIYAPGRVAYLELTQKF
ncbi:TonB-dependent receptor [Sporomusa sphaeroides]|uniref:TonB-dependent receptor plug domain-containing protein n=1 Tax=Sporomusa sphaeroides TaxID=47679 RepID=UPI003D9FC1A8